MNKPEKLVLIEGVFSHQEAKEILRNVFSSKIRFHEHKNFSSQERFGKDDEIAKKRIPELKKEMMRLSEIYHQAETQNKYLHISSEVHISFIEDPS